MDTVVTILAFLGLIVVLVLVHEVGHFVAAKRAGITVQEFGIGFPPRITSVVWHGTRYSLNWIPLGGFVRMLGEDGEGEAEKMRRQGLSESAIERAMEGAFNRRPIWVRLVVLLAGVVMNFLLAAALFGVALSLPIQQGRGDLTVTQIQADSPADGRLRVGDVIHAADGREFQISRDLTEYVRSRAGQVVVLSIERDGETLELPITPRVLTPAEEARGLGAVGFSYEAQTYVELPSQITNPFEAAWRGLAAAGELAIQIPGGLASAIGGLLGLTQDGGTAIGPIGIAQETGRVLQLPLVSQLLFVGILSVNLAVLNVLPFPPLDGGRIAVVLIEAVRRRRLRPEREALIYLTGFMVLIMLVILISIQDVAR